MDLNEFFKTHARNAVLIIIGIIFISYFAMGTWLDKIEISEKKVHRIWGDLKQVCEKRVQMLPQFAQLVTTYAPLASETSSQLNKTYEAAVHYQVPDNVLQDLPTAKAFEALQSNVVTSYENMVKLEAQFPAFGQNRQYLMEKMQLQAMDEQIRLKVKLLNDEIAFYNQNADVYPFKIVNTLLMRKPLKVYISIPTLHSPTS